MTFVIITALILGGVWLYYYLRGNPSFWHLVSEYPDDAYEWFLRDPNWLVVRVGDSEPDFPGGRSEYAGPFIHLVPSQSGARVKLYGHADRIEASQAEFLELLRSRGKIGPA